MVKLSASFLQLALCAVSVRAGTVLWSGLFNSTTTVADFDKWSFSNEIQPWQWYIHGASATSSYLALSSSYKNPADTSDAQGIKMTIDGTSFWNGQTMERSEIIPQTSTNIGTGHLYYHFSMMTSSTNPPAATNEHQIAFFESHFTELKYGLISGEAGTSDNLLRWDTNSQTQWSTQLVPGTWYNFAYDIDFSAGTCGLWQSTGASDLVQVKSGISCSPSTNSADFHIGMLRLPNGGTSTAAEDFYWSGIFVENGPITTSIAGPTPGKGGSGGTGTGGGGGTGTGNSTTTTTTTTSTTSTSSTITSSAPGPTQTKYGQCGGTGWTGATVCASGSTCTAVSPPYYSQCL